MEKRFEGLYFKQQTHDSAVTIIAALHEKGACLQIVTRYGALYEAYPEGFRAVGGYRIGNSLLTPSGIAVDTPHCRGMVLFRGLTPPRYDIMGPFAAVPFMECRHKVVSLRHQVAGSLTVEGRKYDLSGGVGYIEGDRGRSIPRRYLWTQCLFEEGSLMLSMADIPLRPTVFTGIIGFVYMGGREIRLASYLGAKAHRAGKSVLIRQGDLTFTAEMMGKPEKALFAPVNGEMVRTIHEEPACTARYQLFRGGRMLLNLSTDNASFEYEY